MYPTPQGALFHKYIASLMSELLPPSEQSKLSPSKLSMASTSSSSSFNYTPVVQGGRRTSPKPFSGGVYASTGGGGSQSREISPASILSMDELDTEEESTL